MGYIDLPVSGGGITIYPNLAAFPPSAQDGAQGVAADTNSIYIYNSSVPGWVAVATPPVGVFISDLTGDVTATGPGSAAATVAFVGGETAADVAISVQDTQAATDLSTVSTIVKRDASGQTSLDGLNLDGSTSGAISIQAANTTTSYTVKMPAAQGAASTYLQNDGSGNLAWASVSSLPSQTGNNDKVLATDGSSASWQYAGLGDGGLGTGNVVLGRDSLITSGINNTVIGVGATGITTSNGHVLIGSAAAITSGDNAVSIGREASSRTGSVAVGQKAICSAAFAVAIGQESNADEGTVAIGHTANNSSTAIYAVSIGQGSGAAGNFSVAIGYEADTNTQCVNIGAVSRSGTGSDGTFVGYFTGKSSATGANNTAIGSLSGNALSSGASNVFVGKDAGKLVTTGSTNVFVGNTAGDAVTTGNNNVIIGDIAGTSTLSDTVIIAAGTTERMRIDSSGNLSVPNYILSPQLYAGGTKTAAFNIDWANGPVQEFTLNVTGGTVSLAASTWSNPVTGGAYMLKLIQGATPTNITAWPASVLWGAAGIPTLSGATGDIDIINFIYDGTNYYGTYALGF